MAQQSFAGLSARGMTVRFPGEETLALDSVDLDVPAGRVLALLGPSGCGKSTALRVIAGLQPASGSIAFDGVDISALPPHRRGFSLMFQDGQLFGHLNVFDNVAYGLRRRKVAKSEISTRVSALLDLVGLTGFDARMPATLSGGQQQRVALARALAPKPRLLLLDEPLSALDRTLRERLAGDLHDVLRREGVTALFVTHDHDEALTIADDMALMRAGHIVQAGPVREVWAHPVDAQAARFLGYSTVLDAARSQALGLPRGSWALRRTAWSLAGEGEHGLAGSVHRVSGAGDSVHAVVGLDALGGKAVEMAVPAGPAAEQVQVGARVNLTVQTARATRLPDSASAMDGSEH